MFLDILRRSPFGHPFGTRILFTSLLLIAAALFAQAAAQSVSDRTIPVHSLATGLSLPSIAKLNNIVVDADRRKAYFTGDLSDYVGVIDIDSLKMSRVLDSPVKGFVWKRLALNPATGILYLLLPERGQLYRIDPSTGTFSPAIQAQGGIAIDPRTGRVFVLSAASEIRVYSDSLQALGVIDSVSSPFVLAVDTTQNKLYVLHSGSGASAGVSAYDATSFQFLRRYSMPLGFTGRPSRLHVKDGKIYVVSQNPTRSLVVIDEISGSTSLHSIAENPGEMKVHNGQLFLMTGYPFYAGYLPNGDGSYGIIEVRDATTGTKLRDLWCDLETLYFDIDPRTNRLFYSSTGRGIIGVVQLSDFSTIKKIDVCTTIDKVLIHPKDGSLYVQTRLGGSTIYRVNPSAGTLISELITGNWPTDIVIDETRNRLYALNHYEASISAFDITTDSLVLTLPLQIQRGRTDGLSNLALDRSLNKLYAVFPELGTLTAVNADGTGAPLTKSVEGFNPNPSGGGPGKLTIAVNQELHHVYVFLSETKRLNVYDGSTLNLLTFFTFNFSGKLFSDDALRRLFIGANIVDPQTGRVLGRVPQGDGVIAINPARTKVYVGVIDRVFGYDSTLQTPSRQWTFARDNLAISYSVDFSKNWFYGGYFARGVIEAYRLGEVTSAEGLDQPKAIPKTFKLFQNYPNPFNPSTTIRFSLTPSLSQWERVSEGRVRVTLKVFDVLGRQVATLVDEEFDAGEHTAVWDGAGMASGVYFSALQAGGFVQQRKMVLVR